MTPSGNFAGELAGSAIAVRFILTAENRSQGRTGREIMAAERSLPTSYGQLVGSVCFLCSPDMLGMV